MESEPLAITFEDLPLEFRIKLEIFFWWSMRMFNFIKYYNVYKIIEKIL
jgi:hypothetical protein